MDIQFHELVHLVHVEHTKGKQRSLQRMQHADICSLRQRGGGIERVKRCLDVVFRVVEVQDEQVFAQLSQVWGAPVQARQGLHGQHTCQGLVYIHGTQLRLVEACQVFVGYHQDAVVVTVKVLCRLVLRESVQLCLRILSAIDVFCSREGYQYLVGHAVLGHQLLQRVVVHDGTLNILRHHHRLGLTLQFVVAEYLGIKVVEHHLSLGLDGLGVAFHKAAQQSLCLLIVIFRVFLYALSQFVVASVGGVVGQHIQYKSLLDGLLHAVQMEGVEGAVVVLRAKALQRFFLWGSSKGKVATVPAHLSVLHQLLQQGIRVATVLVSVFLHGGVQLVCRNATLAAMCLVDDDGKVMVAHVADGITDEGKLLYRRDDDALVLLYGILQVP